MVVASNPTVGHADDVCLFLSILSSPVALNCFHYSCLSNGLQIAIISFRYFELQIEKFIAFCSFQCQNDGETLFCY